MTLRSQSLTIALGTAVALTFAGLSGSAAAQNMGLVASHGNGDLRVGFTPDPHTVRVRAGGPIDVDDTTLPAACAGTIADAPTYELKYTAGSAPLILRTHSDADTSLIVNGPDGQWRCDDDGGDGLNAELRFDSPKSGTYDIWVGSLEDPGVSASLKVTEQTTSPAAQPDPEDAVWDAIASPPTQVDIKVCNQSGRNAHVAVSYFQVGMVESVTEGWFEVSDGACRSIAQTENLTYYLYADAADGSGLSWGGDFGRCVRYPGPFKDVNHAGACYASQTFRTFRRVDAPGFGENVFNLWP